MKSLVGMRGSVALVNQAVSWLSPGKGACNADRARDSGLSSQAGS